MSYIDVNIDQIVLQKQYQLCAAEKEAILLPILREQLRAAVINPYIRSFFQRLRLDIDGIHSLDQVPFIPSQMFKQYNLATCLSDSICRVVKSSATTSAQPAQIPLNKVTSLRQTKALLSILKSYIRGGRKSLLLFDIVQSNSGQGLDLSARGAAIRGLSMFAKEVVYLLKENPDGTLALDFPKLKEVSETLKNAEVILFGFTFIIWSLFHKQLFSSEISLNFKDTVLFHSGGWKKLKELSVSKEVFNREISRTLNIPQQKIIDFYGMAEQLGVIFPDCEYLNKHTPDFADIIIRHPLTAKPSGINEIGFIEVLSILGDSYYSQAILTEDLGVLRGIDDCPCGRKGKYFHFVSRIEHAELRGCGDTFAANNKP